MSTYGLGTSEPAERAPKLATPEEAWVCVYGPSEGGPGPGGDGMTTEWVRTQGPVQAPHSALAELELRLDALKPAASDRICNMDLGPRFVLVFRHGTDLTGVGVDDYGCGEIRLTDEPFTTVAGEAGQGGTVPGVLQAPSELLNELKAIAPSKD